MRSRLAALAALLSLSACALPSLEIQPRYARFEISGQAGMTSGGVGGSADVEEAGLDEDETWAARADLKFGAPHLIGLAQQPRFEGTGTLDVTVTDGTDTITAGATVDSKADLDMYDLALVFDLIPGDTLELAIGFGAAYLDLDFRFEEQGTGTTVASQEEIPVPLLAAAGAVWLGPVEIAAFAGGMEYTLDDDSIAYLDADVYARLKLFGGDELLRVSLVAGYRYTDFELEYDDDSSAVDADLTIQGPYVGLDLSL